MNFNQTKGVQIQGVVQKNGKELNEKGIVHETDYEPFIDSKYLAHKKNVMGGTVMKVKK